MSYKYRVTLKGIKGFYRVYLLAGSNTLYTFHKRLTAELEFPQDQPILFKAFDEKGFVAGRFALTPLPGNKAVDEVSIAEVVKAGIASFEYFYDIVSRKSVIITLEGEVPENVASPVCVDSKGPLPIEFENGYVAFEDLPDDKRKLPGEGDEDDDDDEDFDDDDSEEGDEEDGDEESEEIVDESEL